MYRFTHIFIGVADIYISTVCAYVCVCVYVRVFVCVCVCIYMYVYMYIYIHIYGDAYEDVTTLLYI